MKITRLLLGVGIAGLSLTAWASPHHLSGIVDVRVSDVDGADSYVDRQLGKYRFNTDTHFGLAQLGLSYQYRSQGAWSFHGTVNGYGDGVDNNVGLTEAYVNYRGLPNQFGARFSARFGVMYPQISLENNATAWASSNTLSYSMINSWIGEEVKHVGARFQVELLGRARQSNDDLGLTTDIFSHNDTTGTMLAWHGWTQSDRQTLLQEHLPIPATPALIGGDLQNQATDSDPFVELDDRMGVHTTGYWRRPGFGEVHLGYYDNHADMRVVKEGQYAWGTRFSHLGVKWRLPYRVALISQYMRGNTTMKGPSGNTVVDNDFYAAFIMVSRRWHAHQFAVRIEDFEVTDIDSTIGDNNAEDGHALTLSYRYQLTKGWYLQTEYNRIDSRRSARHYWGEDIHLIEQQWQLALRHFF